VNLDCLPGAPTHRGLNGCCRSSEVERGSLRPDSIAHFSVRLTKRPHETLSTTGLFSDLFQIQNISKTLSLSFLEINCCTILPLV
jgi:hypothetical protein